MELADLVVFRTVVTEGGITRAAERLHRVPSNVTVRVRNLEQELGVALFVREGRRLRLSPSGERLLEYADRLLNLAKEARAAVVGNEPRGVLRLGAMESAAAARLPRVLAAFQKTWPAVSVDLYTGDPRELIARVLSGALDAALVTEPIDDPRLASIAAFREELVIVAGPQHRPIRSPQDLRNPVLLAFHPGCPHRQRLETWFARAGHAPQRIIEVGSYHAILGCAVAGMGIALMPRSVLDTYTERHRLSVHALTGDLHFARTLLVWRSNAPSANVRAFADVVAKQPDSKGARADGASAAATAGTAHIDSGKRRRMGRRAQGSR